MSDVAFDPLIPTLARQASARQIIQLPWHTRPILLGAFFSSTKATSTEIDPFVEQSAFDDTSLQRSKIVFSAYDGDASYKSSESTSSSASTDHLSKSIGAGLDCPCISASVSCQYDTSVMENHDASKTSIMTSYRVGSITFMQPPELSEDALIMLKYGDGLQGFKNRWGDYYVAGYRIGGDAGVMLSQSFSKKHTSDLVKVAIKVETLLWDYEENESSSWATDETDIQISTTCFSSIEKRFVNEKMAMGDPRMDCILNEAREIHKRAQGFDDATENILKRLGISKEKVVTVEQCKKLCQSGAVVELLLVPIENLRDLQYWVTDSNIICF